MRRHLPLLVRWVCGLSLIVTGSRMAVAQDSADGPGPALAISFALPDRADSPDRHPIYAVDKKSRFHVVLTNRGKETLRLADLSRDEGPATLTFEIIDDKGNKTTAERTPLFTGGSKRGVSGYDLRPGENAVFQVDFLNPESWTGFPKLPSYGNSLSVQMRAIFEVKAGQVEEAYWTGRVATDLETVTFQSRISGETRAIGVVAETGNSFGKVHYYIEAEGPDDRQTLKQLTVSSNGREMPVPAEAIAGIQRPLLKTHSTTVEDDGEGRPVLYISFDLGTPPNEKDAVGPPRVSFGFQDGKFLKRLTSIHRRHVVEEWQPKASEQQK